MSATEDLEGLQPEDTPDPQLDARQAQEFENLLEYLKRSREFDFTGYKRASPLRRIRKRMQAVGVEDFATYMDYIEVHPEEFARLFDTVLINDTGFFRDMPAWEFLMEETLPRIIASKAPGEPIRVWCACCASGEEAYTLSMAFAEVMGLEAARDRVKIYATDIDEEALTHARHAIYSPRQVAGVPEPLLGKYFEPQPPSYRFSKELRRSVLFGRHDILKYAPLSRIDLLSCRNALMYFNAEAQARILARFHFALNDPGCLFLGKAEMLLNHANLFQPLDLKQRVFTKVPRPPSATG